MSISAVIPAYNEELFLADTLISLRQVKEIHEIIVVNDGSRDNTAEIGWRYADDVIDLPLNLGKGGALKKGVERASGEILVFVDGDLQESALLCRELFRPVLNDEADMCIAILPPALQRGGFGLVKGLARKGIQRLTGYEPLAPLSGQRALTRNVASSIRSWDAGFGIEVGMTIDALRAGFRVREVPVPFSHRETRRNLPGFLHRGRQFIEVGRMLRQKWHSPIS